MALDIVLGPMADKVSLQHRLGQKLLQLAVLVLKCPQPPCVRHFQAAILRVDIVSRTNGVPMIDYL